MKYKNILSYRADCRGISSVNSVIFPSPESKRNNCKLLPYVSFYITFTKLWQEISYIVNGKNHKNRKRDMNVDNSEGKYKWMSDHYLNYI